MVGSVLANAVVNITANSVGLNKEMALVHKKLGGFVALAGVMGGNIGRNLIGPIIQFVGLAKAASGGAPALAASAGAIGLIGIAAAAATGSVIALTAALYGAAKAAAELAGTSRWAQHVFGSSIKVIEDGAQRMAEQFGMAKKEYLDAATQIGLGFKVAGFKTDEAATMAVEAVKLARSLASVKDVSFDQALNEINAALKGQTHFFSEAQVQAYAYLELHHRLHQPISETERALINYRLTLRHLSGIQEEATQSGGHFGDQLKALGGGLSDLATTIGTAVAPAFAAFLGGVNWLLSKAIGFVRTFLDLLFLLPNWLAKLAGFGGPELDEKLAKIDETNKAVGEQAKKELITAQAMGTQVRMPITAGGEDYRRRLAEGAVGGRFSIQKRQIDLAVQQNEKLQRQIDIMMQGKGKGPIPAVAGKN